jgi:RNA polymerase sigma factor (sigma-70 family)
VPRCDPHKRRDTVDVGDAGHAQPLRVEPVPDRTVDLERAGAAVRAAIDRLPSEQKEAVLLRYMDDLPYDEIARITGAPTGTVASMVFRALERLGREIEPRHTEVLR